MKIRELLLALMVDLVFYVLVSNFLPSTTPYFTLVLMLTPTLFWVLVTVINRKRKGD